MVRATGYQTAARLGRPLPRARPQRCRECIQLGTLLSLVRFHLHFSWILPCAEMSYLATTCSRSEQLRRETSHNLSLPRRTYSVLPKRVRNLFLDGFFARRLANVGTSGAATAIITNPFWLVRVRMFTTNANSPSAYRGLWGASL